MADMSHPEASAEGSSQATTAAVSAKVKNTTPIYEVGFHIVPTVGDEGVAAVVDTLRKALGNVEIISEGFPNKITLAYQVERATQGKREKYTESYFGHIKFAMEREEISVFTDAVRAMQPIVRFLIIETVREDVAAAPRRTVFTSDRLEGKTIEKPVAAAEKTVEVSESELDKSLEALTG